jgi:hypothetical protein
MKRTVYASFILDSKKPFAEIEKDREWVLKTLKQMMVRKFRIAPFGFDFRLEVNSQAFALWLQALQERPDLAPSHIRVERIYTDQELSSAPLLEWGPTNQAIEDDYYDLKEDGYQGGPQASHRRCPACRAELEQVRDLLVDTRLMGQRDLSLTYSFEIILSARLARMLQEAGFTGFTLRPVWDYRKPYQGEPKLYQLVVTNVLPPMASPPTEFEQAQRCEVCGTQTQYLKHTHFWGRIQYYEETDIYYAREVLEQAADFNATYERIGGLPDGHPLVLISQRVYRWLKEQGIKGWSARPVYLVGSSTLTSE